jgi:hypothetical protein
MRRKRPLVAALTSLALLAVTPSIARADNPSPQATAALRADLGKSAWNASAKMYKAALANRDITTRAINEVFTKAVKHAKKDLSTALASAKVPKQKSAAAARFKDALDQATAMRQAAINALPQLPPNPGPKPSGK